MNRRQFLQRSALIASGAVAADQLELLERLTASRIFALGGPRSLVEAGPPLDVAAVHAKFWRKITGPIVDFAFAGPDRRLWYEPRLVGVPGPWQAHENVFHLDIARDTPNGPTV